MEKGIISLDDLRDTSFPVQERVLYAVLCVAAGAGNTAAVTENYLIARTGCTQRRLRKAVATLCARGKISIEKGDGKKMVYTLHRVIPSELLEELRLEDEKL